jgi:hypothetical protein
MLYEAIFRMRGGDGGAIYFCEERLGFGPVHVAFFSIRLM